MCGLITSYDDLARELFTHEEESDYDIAIQTFPLDMNRITPGMTEREIGDELEREFWQSHLAYWQQAGICSDPIDATAHDIEWAAQVIWSHLNDR